MVDEQAAHAPEERLSDRSSVVQNEMYDMHAVTMCIIISGELYHK